MAYNVGEAEVTVVPNAQRFNEDLAAKLLPAAAETGRKMGDELADGIRERLALVGDVHIGVDTGKASAEVDKFLAETDVKAKVAGDEAGKSLGNNLSKSAADSARGGSPLIMAAVAGGLIAGGPLILGAAGVVFGGLAALILHNQDNVATAARQMSTAVISEYTKVAQVAAPFMVQALNEIKSAALAMAPTVGQIFKNLQPAIQGVTQGVLDLARNALPGMAQAVAAGAPVFDGLHVLLADIGTGLGNMFSLISQHAPAMGQVMSSLGSILDSLLTSVGSLAVAGGELGAIVLPPLADALSVVADVLHTLEPILPGIALGFAAFKVTGTLAPLLATFAANMEKVGASAMVSVAEMTGLEGAGLAAGTGFGAAAAGARGLETAMGPIGWILAGIGGIIPLVVGKFGEQDQAQKVVKDSADAMTQALQASKGAIDDQVRSTAIMQAQKDGLFQWANSWGVTSAQIIGAATGNAAAIDAVTRGAHEYAASQLGAAGATDKNTVAGLASQGVLKGVAGASNDALAALLGMGGATDSERVNQQLLKDALSGSADAAEKNATRLDGLKNAASAANTQVGLLKGALDALTGKTISMDDATVAVTQAVINAASALKGQKGALTDASGALNLHTARGAAAYQALKQLAGASNTLIGTMEQQGATTGAVAAKDAQLRATFIQTARQMGFSAGQAQDLANKILGIPSARKTEITVATGQAITEIGAVLTQLARVRDKTITITTVGRDFHIGSATSAPGKRVAGAIGGIVHPFATGGIEPMRGGIAQVVPPGTLRVIGDRVKDDEAYIPINRDLRSIAIWRQAGERMGQLATASSVGASSGASASGGSIRPTFHVDTMIVPDKQHPAETAEQLAFLARTRG